MKHAVVTEVNAVDLRAALADKAMVLDVREPFEYSSGHLEGAESMPMRQVPQRLDEIPKETTVYVICRSGNRSWQVCQFLNQHGYHAVNVAGGMVAMSTTGIAMVGGPR